MSIGAATAAARAAEYEYEPRRPLRDPRTGSGAPRSAPARGQHRSARAAAPAHAPRRVSGPVRTAARPTAPAQRPVASRRVAAAGAVPASRLRRQAQPVTVGGALARPLLAIGTLPDNRLLDRIVRGRAWIPVLGVLLFAIVATQVEVLKFGQVVGNSTALVSQLTARNASLRNQLADLSSPTRIERLAAELGMRTPGPTSFTFLSAGGPGSVSRAISGITPPNQSAFTPLSSTSGDIAGATALTTSTGASTGGDLPTVNPASTAGSPATTPTGANSTAATTPTGTAPTNTTAPTGTSTGGAGI